MDGRSSDSGTFTATPRVALALGALVSAASQIDAVRRSDLAAGDRLMVSTKNSIYSLEMRADGRFDVSGGWYSRHPAGGEAAADGHILAVSGCTAGGHALFTSIVAAPGLFLEFSDGTRTTRIRRVRRIAAESGIAADDVQ